MPEPQDLNVVHETPVLQAKTSDGKDKFWQGMVGVSDDGTPYKYARYWQEVSSGQPTIQFSVPTEVEGKNIGRSNETTPLEQAISEVDSQESRKRDDGYHEEDEETEVLLSPMLAHPWEKVSHRIEPPYYLQPKFDGCRALFDGDQMWSRKGKPFVPEVYDHIVVLEVPGRMVLDGEMMLPHEEFTFQQSVSAIKKWDEDLSPQLQYCVYDLYDPDQPDMPFEDRIRVLRDVLIDNAPLLERANVVPSPSYIVQSDGEISMHHDRFVSQGYEGTIVRTASGIYKVGKRSPDLVKMKDFEDDEFEIIGTGEGKGKFKGRIMFTCATPSGGEFSCAMGASDEERKRLFEIRDTLVGKMLTVKYQELTDDGIPRFPVGMSIRDEEVQGR